MQSPSTTSFPRSQSSKGLVTRGWRAVVLLTIVGVVLAACGGADDKSSNAGDSAPAAGEAIKIGFIGPFSGNFAVSTQAVKQTVDVWIAETNKQGGILGRPVQSVERDDQASSELSQQLVRQSVESGINIFIGPVITAAALQPLQSQLNFINFTILPTPALNDGTLYPNTFNTYPTNQLTYQFLASQLQSKRLLKWALLADTSAQQQAYYNGLRTLAPSVGAQIVYTATFDPQTTDLSPQAQGIRDSGADAVLFFAVGAPVSRFFQAIQAANVKTPIYSSGAISASDLSVAPTDVLRTQVYGAITKTAVLQNGKPAPGLEPLTKALYAKFGKDAIKGSGMVIQFEAMELMKFAIEKAGGPDPAKMREVMNTQVKDRSFLTPALTWTYSTTDHGGYTDDPARGLALARPVPSTEWPGYFNPAN